MSNLNNMREKVSTAIRDGDLTITLGVEEAKMFIRESESMHGGCHDIKAVQDENKSLRVMIEKLQARLDSQNEEVDKVAALLPGGGE